MTGYAVTTRETSGGTLTIEIKSVNSRFLDLQFRINDDLRALEPALREAIMGRVTRGKVECRLSFGRKTTTGAAQWIVVPGADARYRTLTGHTPRPWSEALADFLARPPDAG